MSHNGGLVSCTHHVLERWQRCLSRFTGCIPIARDTADRTRLTLGSRLSVGIGVGTIRSGCKPRSKECTQVWPSTGRSPCGTVTMVLLHCWPQCFKGQRWGGFKATASQIGTKHFEQVDGTVMQESKLKTQGSLGREGRQKHLLRLSPKTDRGSWCSRDVLDIEI